MLIKKFQTARHTYQNNGIKGIALVILQKLLKSQSAIDISDDYINWLFFANAGMMTRGNLYCFDYAIRNLPNNSPIIEIGSFCGLSANVITYYKQKYGVKNFLITCDKWEFEGAGDWMLGDSSTHHFEYRDFVKDTYARNIRMFSRYDLPYTIEKSSDEFFKAWRQSKHDTDILGRTISLGGNISFCHIDGNHSYKYVKQDFENCDEFLVSGGFILFDDSFDGSGFEVCKVVSEICESDEYEVVIKNPNYLFRKK